ncbi:MAG: hypothetical protein K8M05_41455, partial [Deltaproteobacteria bacterium]|nr:hypothetical protein [Kofleriaceae bacterium]
PELHADLDAVVAIAMARSPRHRYTSAAELGADLSRALEGSLPMTSRRRAAEARPILEDTLVAR